MALIIGDGVAEGIGDQFSYAGLAQRVQNLFNAPRADTKLGLRWHVFSLGKLYSTSEDWLPGSNLLENALVHGPYARSEIVAYVIGSHEHPRDAPAGADNVSRTAEAIARLGKHVVVCAYPNLAERGTPEYAAYKARQRLVCEKLQEAKNRLEDVHIHIHIDASATQIGSIEWGVDIDKVLMRRGDVIRVENRFTTLNSWGYRAFARELFDSLALAAKKVEWVHFKKLLKKN